MVKCFQKRTIKPSPTYVLSVETLHIAKPKRLKEALTNPLWVEVMHEESRALDHNKSKTLVPRTPNMDVDG